MKDSLLPYMGFGTGILLGLFYFGGLWLTVCFIHKSKKPRRYLLQSFFVRIIPVGLTIWQVAKLDFVALFSFLVGFFLTRFVLTRVLGPSTGRIKDAA